MCDIEDSSWFSECWKRSRIYDDLFIISVHHHLLLYQYFSSIDMTFNTLLLIRLIESIIMTMISLIIMIILIVAKNIFSVLSPILIII